MQKAIAILYQGRKQDTSELARQLAPQLQAQGHDVRVVDMRDEDEEQADFRLDDCDFALVLGGDGTILHATRLCAPAGIPLLGVNFGRVGFLTELEPDEVTEHLPLYIERDQSVWLDERAMLSAELHQDGGQEEFLALNDIVIARGTWPRVVEIHIWVDDYFYNKTYADGIILSTATGSTAYNMAVGGPLLHPQVESSVLTPIAPHLAFDRSLILQPEARVRLQIFTGTQDGVFSADGQMNREIKNGATVNVRKSQYTARFLRRRPPTYFYQIISAKLREDS
ncbi:MAG TPA: NAD(+)/NADH kinase [Ktedonobacteraceae bacterium]|jgi:NAD+ kinase|nr:NAD(+)/NADH kinase [Ktedonobacteraceae bacterium]